MANEDAGKLDFAAMIEERARLSDVANGLSYERRSKVIAAKKRKALVSVDREKHQARIGGPLRTPDYKEAYLLAAERLVEAAEFNDERDDLCVPIMYCLRHCVEIGLKDLLRTCLDIRLAVSGTDNDLQRPSVDDLNDMHTHNLNTLVNSLEGELERLKLGVGLPSKLRKIAIDLHNLEPDGHEGERFRYSRLVERPSVLISAVPDVDYCYHEIRTKQHVPKINSSFPESETFEIRALTRRTREAVDEEFVQSVEDLEKIRGFEALLLQEQQKQQEHLAREGWEKERTKEKAADFVQKFTNSLNDLQEEESITPDEGEWIADRLDRAISVLLGSE